MGDLLPFDPKEAGIDEQTLNEVQRGIAKYKHTVLVVEDELYVTLNYVNNQLTLIEDQIQTSNGQFTKAVYEAKKWLVEQKLQLLRQLSTLAGEQVKVTSADTGSEITNITDLFDKNK